MLRLCDILIRCEALSSFQSREAIRCTATVRPDQLVMSFTDDRAICMYRPD
jgi:hypothetical protein